jgi:hypothetical protein
MRKKVLIVVDSDPRQSPRAAEALRVAAGLAAWMTNELTVCLMGPAAMLLSTNVDLIGDEDVRIAWPVLREARAAVFVDAIPPTDCLAIDTARQITPPEFARLAGEMDCLLRF